MSGRESLILTATEVERVLSVEACIDAVDEAFRLLGRGLVAPPEILGLHVDGGGFHVKAATLRRGGRHYFAAKTNGNFPSNPSRNGLPSIQGVIVLCDADVGTPLLVSDSGRLTELRTAAATAVAARHLARSDSSVVTLIGCGAQARSHLRALAAVRALSRVVVLDLDRERAVSLAREMDDELDAEVVAGEDVHTAVGACDICVTCTPSADPILVEGMPRAGTLVAAVGADSPLKQEIAPGLLRGSKVVVDSLTQCSEIGDLHHALRAGLMRPEDVHAELGAVVAGLAPGRESEEEVIVFDSTGLGLQDVACASVAYERALVDGHGARVTFSA